MYGPDDLAPAAGVYSGDDMGVSIWRAADARDERHDYFRQDGGGHNVTIIYVLLVAHFVSAFERNAYIEQTEKALQQAIEDECQTIRDQIRMASESPF